MKYRKKPVVIEAEQFYPDKKWPEGVKEDRRSPTGFCIDTQEPDSGAWDGQEVTPGDWIITGIKGERYPCKPDIFAATYELVEG